MNDTSDEQIPPQQPPAGDADAGSSPPPPPPGGAARPLLRRDDHKAVAGVAGGLADFVGVDPTVVRVAFVVLTVFGGIGIPLYLVGWAGLRTPSMPESHAERWFRGAPNPAVLIVLAIGFIVLISVVHAEPGDGVGWGLALLFAGWLLFRADNRAVAGGAPTAPPPAADAWPSGGGWHGAGGTTTAPPSAAPAAVWQPAPPRPRSILGRLTFGLVLVALGVAALLDQLGVVDLRPVHYPALAMTIIGLGLIVGAWVGRAYGLVWLGLLLVPVTIAASFAPLNVRGGAGDVTHRPASLAAVDEAYHLGLGKLLLDLSAVDFQDTATQIEVSVGVGETTIIVPNDVTVAVSGEMRAGSANLFGARLVGDPFLTRLDDVDEGTGGGRLALIIDHGLGDLTIRRANQEF